MRDLHAHEQAARLLASITIVFSVVPIAAPILGAQLAGRWGWQAVFWAIAAVGAALLVASAAGLRETAPPSAALRASARAGLGRFASILARPALPRADAGRLLLQVGLLHVGTNSAFTLVRGQGVSTVAYGLDVRQVMLGQIGGAWVASRQVMRFGIARLMQDRRAARAGLRRRRRRARLGRRFTLARGRAALRGIPGRHGARDPECDRDCPLALSAAWQARFLAHRRHHQFTVGAAMSSHARRALRRHGAADGDRRGDRRRRRLSHREATPPWKRLDARRRRRAAWSASRSRARSRWPAARWSSSRPRTRSARTPARATPK